MADYPRPSNGWGQAAANNTNGFGQGAGNSTNGWGYIHAFTPPHPGTDLVGIAQLFGRQFNGTTDRITLPTGQALTGSEVIVCQFTGDTEAQVLEINSVAGFPGGIRHITLTTNSTNGGASSFVATLRIGSIAPSASNCKVITAIPCVVGQLYTATITLDANLNITAFDVDGSAGFTDATRIGRASNSVSSVINIGNRNDGLWPYQGIVTYLNIGSFENNEGNNWSGGTINSPILVVSEDEGATWNQV